jgi:hypothetical protein
MLDGKSPLIILHRALKTPGGAMEGPASVNRFAAIGVPIPIYLDERILAMAVESETRNIGIPTRIITNSSSDSKTGTTAAPKTIQEGGESQYVINFVANRKSLYLQTLLTFGDMAMDAASSEEIKFSYFNGPTVMIMGVLNGITTSATADSTKLNVSISFSKSETPSWVAIAALAGSVAAARIIAPVVTGVVPALPAIL